MKIRFGELKKFIREEAHHLLKEDWWAESYSKQLYDDPALDDNETLWIERSSKKQIKNWLKAMGLATK